MLQVSNKVKDAFVDEIMEVVELTPIRNSIVGLPGARSSVPILAAALSWLCSHDGVALCRAFVATV